MSYVGNIFGRGAGKENDNGHNLNYYLIVNKFYRLLSPHSIANSSIIICIGAEGDMGGTIVQYDTGGVHYSIFD